MKFQVGSLSENKPDDPIFDNFTDALAEAKRQVSQPSEIDNGLWVAVWVLPEEDCLPWIAVVVNSPVGDGEPLLFWSEHEDAEEWKQAGFTYLARMERDTEYIEADSWEKAVSLGVYVALETKEYAVIYRKDAANRTSTECVVMHQKASNGAKEYFQGEKIITVG